MLGVLKSKSEKIKRNLGTHKYGKYGYTWFQE